MIERIRKIVAGKKFRELVRYGIAGVVTSLVNIGVFYVLNSLGINYKISNIFAIVLSKVTAFFSNKYYVFHSRCESFGAAVKECLKFIVARGFTGVVDYFGVIFMVDMLKIDENISKITIQVLVIILNYVFGKLLVFNKKKNKITKESDSEVTIKDSEEIREEN